MAMQGDELKALRKRLGWTQGRMAAELDLSTTFVGLMERGEKAIERRTELAVKALEDIPATRFSSAELAARGIIAEGN
ncbi:helix-turn-helix domain-containing protein [Sphingobium sp. WCS2017Hpa-17]|uniref:helix-turn-helix domain-containing protein n=1 Tax=Sphingobium sp. WCS2017Hpa-17 TaxID=3073638 RepID=UPI00288A4E1C|nr:helix-turn-helix domain-containing protein [Sphingobium sp. WCS2017Hpa-17]